MNNNNFLFSGFVPSIKNGIVQTYDLGDTCFGELISFNNNLNVLGMILTLKNTEVEIVVLTGKESIKIGDTIFKTGFGDFGKFPSIQVGYTLLGKHINALGVLANKADLNDEEIFEYEYLNNNFKNVFKKAPGITFRESVRYSFYTDYQIIDNFFPIGCGQRALLICDKFTVKTTIAITAIINQLENNYELLNKLDYKTYVNNYIKKNTVFCIYATIGQHRSIVLRLYNLLNKRNALNYTCIFSSTSSCKEVLQYLISYIGTTIEE